MSTYQLTRLHGPELAAPEMVPAAAKRTLRSAARLAARWVKITALWTVLGLAAGLILSITVPYLFGYRSMTVLSGSMEPTIHVGDVVVVRQVAPLDVKVGDIVSFRDPSDVSRIITHRVREIQVSGNYVEFTTKGDANTGVEHWKVSTDGTIGRVVYHVWRIGYALFWIRGRLGRIILLVIPALSLGGYEIWRIWRPRPQENDEAAA